MWWFVGGFVAGLLAAFAAFAVWLSRFRIF